MGRRVERRYRPAGAVGGGARPLAVTGLCTAAGPAWAAPVAVTGLGPWIFASVALLLVAVLAWAVGRSMGRREALAEARARLASRAAQAPALAPKPATAQALPKVEDAAAFSYAMSHDLRAPLRVVEGFARILKEDYGRQLDRIGNDHLDRLLGAAARMNSMIEGMLGLAQLSQLPLERQPVNLTQLAGFIIDDLKRADPRRRVEVDIAPHLEVMGDPGLLRRMLENLLGNAWKYTARKERGQISLRSREQNGQTVFEVADNGAGFDMSAAAKLFGLFQRLHGQNDFPGSGLGLASVQRIVHRHGGRIWAEAEPGKGARFFFTLPG